VLNGWQKIGAIKLDVGLSREEFYYADCISIQGSAIIGYQLISDRVIADEAAEVDVHDLADVVQLFSVEFDGSTYGGGEALDHGSYGYFFKKTNGRFGKVCTTPAATRVDACVFT
jgi:hypothetical protein